MFLIDFSLYKAEISLDLENIKIYMEVLAAEAAAAIFVPTRLLLYIIWLRLSTSILASLK